MSTRTLEGLRDIVGDVTFVNMGPVETIMDFVNRRAPHVKEVNQEKIRRLMIERDFRLLVRDAGDSAASTKKSKKRPRGDSAISGGAGGEGIEFPYTQTREFKHCIIQLVGEAFPYANTLGIVVLKIQRTLSEWVAQHAQRSMSDMRSFFPVSVVPLTARDGQLVHINYTRSIDAGRDRWIYVPRDPRDTGYVYIVYLNPIWGGAQLCALSLLVEDAHLPKGTLALWESLPSATIGQGGRGAARGPMTLWSPYWHLYRLNAEIMEVRRNRMRSDHALSSDHTIFRSLPPSDVLPEHTTTMAQVAAPHGSLPAARQAEGIMTALQLHKAALALLKEIYGDGKASQSDDMARMYGRPRPNESWSLLPPFVEVAHHEPPSSLLDLELMEQHFRELVAGLMSWKELLGQTGGGGGAKKGGAAGKKAPANTAAVEAEAEESKSLMHEERQLISSMVGRIYAATFAYLDLDALAHVLDAFTIKERHAVGQALRVHSKATRGATQRFKDIVLEQPLVPADGEDPIDADADESLRQAIAHRLATHQYLEARLVFSQDEDEAAEADTEANKLPHQRQTPEQQQQTLGQFGEFKDLFLNGTLDPEDMRAVSKRSFDMDLPTLRRPPPPPTPAKKKAKK